MLAATACGSDAPTAPNPSPWPERIVTANGTTLHTIDYGGTGTAIIFLAGLGNSAHVFDGFAPRFTDRNHVYAFTRRGFGQSGRPATGYDTPSLARDVIALMDSLGIERAVLAGHSLAGDELTEVAAAAPGRVAGVAFIEAAYDRSYTLERLAEAQAADALPPTEPAPSAAQRGSPEAYRAFLAAMRGVTWPLAEVKASFRFDGTGRLVGPAADAATTLKVLQGETPPRIAEVEVPVLAIYAVQRDVSTEFPWIAALTHGRAEQEARARRYLTFQQTWEAEQREGLRMLLPNARVVEVPGASHYVFLSHPDLVERELRDFVAAIARG